MRRIENRRPSAATVISVIALFVALGGTSYAAVALPRNSVGSAQVINGSLSKADLSKKAVSALKGRRGAPGLNGAQGAQGASGPQGPAGANGAAGVQGSPGSPGSPGASGSTGPAGPFPDGNMPSGKTLRGNWITSSHTSGGGTAFSAISFGFTLASAPTIHLLEVGAAPTTACPGSVSSPQALAGHLCVYTHDNYNVTSRSLCDPLTNVCGISTGNRWGIIIEAETSGTGNFYTWGTWAVTSA